MIKESIVYLVPVLHKKPPTTRQWDAAATLVGCQVCYNDLLLVTFYCGYLAKHLSSLASQHIHVLLCTDKKYRQLCLCIYTVLIIRGFSSKHVISTFNLHSISPIGSP